MQIKGFFCSCVGREVADDHYSSGSCKNPPMPIPWILGALDKEGSPTAYMFRCRKCGQLGGYQDCD